jgi:hypothetical protein
MNAKKSINSYRLLKTSIEDNIDEDNKDSTINHPLFYDELKSTMKKDIHNIAIQQNAIQKNTTMKA